MEHSFYFLMNAVDDSTLDGPSCTKVVHRSMPTDHELWLNVISHQNYNTVVYSRFSVYLRKC